MAKSEPKTMRFESDVEAYINAQKGENFSEKFHVLVRKMKDTEPERIKKISLLDKEIKDREKRLQDLQNYLYDAAGLERSFKELQKSMTSCKQYFEKILPKEVIKNA